VTEALIRQRVEDLAKTVRAKDIDRVMSFYTADIVSFDIGPPLRYGGTDNKRRAGRDAFATYAGPMDYEIRDRSVTTEGSLAFAHSVNHVKGTCRAVTSPTCGCDGRRASGKSTASGGSCTTTCRSLQTSSMARLRESHTRRSPAALRAPATDSANTERG
jgi:ketosteroid isomerase-like protein